MAKFREPFYVEKKYIVMKILAIAISVIYITSTLIGIYSMYFAVDPIEWSAVENSVIHQEVED